MQRINTLTWSDAEMITRKMGKLQDQLMKHQKYTWPPENQSRGLGGDMDVMVEAIGLRDMLIKIIERSRNANL